MIKSVWLLGAFFLLSSVSVSAAETTTKVYYKNIESSERGFRKELRVEAPEYKRAVLADLEMRIAQRTIDGEDVQVLYVKGRVKNMSNGILAGVKVEARLLDEKGKVLASGYDGVLPRILREKDARAGTFSIPMPYDDAASECRLDIFWSGKR